MSGEELEQEGVHDLTAIIAKVGYLRAAVWNTVEGAVKQHSCGVAGLVRREEGQGCM